MLVQNLDMYLINEGKAWYLTDAGGFDSWLDAHASRIVKAVQSVIPPGQELKYIICKYIHWGPFDAINHGNALFHWRVQASV